MSDSAGETAVDSNLLLQADSPGMAGESLPRLRRRMLWCAGLALLGILALVAPFAYKFWEKKQRESFKSRCVAAQKAKQWRHVLDLSRSWRDWDPRDDDALMFIAQAAVELEQLETAVDALGQVANGYHGALQGLAFRGEILYTGLNRPFDAEATWLRMVEIQPRASVARQRLIFFYAMTLQRRKMAAQIEEAMQLGCEPPEAYPYLIMKDVLNFSDGLAQTTRWLMATPGNETLEAAQAVYAAKQSDSEMVAAFASQAAPPGDNTLVERCLQKYPSNLEVLAVKLDRAIFEGDAGLVLTLLEQAAPEAESDGRFWRYRGWLLSTNGRHREAIDSLQHAIELNSFDWHARWLLADIHRKLGNIETADELSALALQGKELQRKIFERPNARELDESLVREIYAYTQRTGPESMVSALARRL